MDRDIDVLSSVWRKAGDVLGVSIQAPYVFVAQDGGEFRCLAFMPDFGGPKGMLVAGTHGPEFKTDPALSAAAASAGLYCSFVNADAYCIFDGDSFKEALRDWGFFGNPCRRPSWL
jgi:hypothetical protein